MKAGPLLLILFLLITLSRPSPAGEDTEGYDPYFVDRMRMVATDIEGRGINDKKVLKAMRTIKRHLFVPPQSRSASYSDYPLPIGEGQTISQPYIVALMTEKLALKGGEKVLEIGTGSGYQAAVLADIGAEVRTIEIIGKLADSARERLHDLGFTKVKVRCGDGYFGWPEEAPFDAIIVTAAANHIPLPLLRQLKEGGRLIIPLGSTTYYQTLTLVTNAPGGIQVEHITGVAFVPMTGKMLEEE